MTTDPERASFTPQSGPAAGVPIEVHFNPEKLQIDISNTLEDKGRGNEKKQYVSKSSAKLGMELIFDTTHDGSDVRLQTGKIAKLMEPGKQEEGDQGTPPSIVLFEWGSFKFQGLIESYKETLDFFARDGVPLRASLSLSLASQDKIFERLSAAEPGPRAEPLVQRLSPEGESLTGLASRGGNPTAARALASANGLESMRLARGEIAISGAIRLAPPVAFPSSQVPSPGGARLAGSAQRLRLNLERLRQRSHDPLVDTGPNSSFAVGGRGASSGPSGLKADVGATRRFQERLQFL
jgi:hypothetical protein